MYGKEEGAGVEWLRVKEALEARGSEVHTFNLSTLETKPGTSLSSRSVRVKS